MDLGLGSGIWLLGDRYVSAVFRAIRSAEGYYSFMKNVYTVFSVSQNAVGFATLK